MQRLSLCRGRNSHTGGFAPAFSTDSILQYVEEAQIIHIIDSDSLEVLINSGSNKARIYRAGSITGFALRH